MPTAVIVIFLLFFAVLAFGWFYLQRAKARETATSVDAAPATAPSTSVTTTDRTDTPVA
jgi:Flp pilus assembly protein TadG